MLIQMQMPKMPRPTPTFGQLKSVSAHLVESVIPVSLVIPFAAFLGC